MNLSTDINLFNNMEETKSFEEKYEQATPEERKALTIRLLHQNSQLANAVRQLQDTTAFKRLDYLFKVVDSAMFDEEFENRCKEEIKFIMFGEPSPEEASKETEK